MSDRTYAKAQAQQKTLTGSSPKSSLLQRTCACGQHTIAGGECDACRREQSTLLRSQRAFGPPSASVAAQGNAPAQENSTSFNAAFDRASRFGHDFSQIPIHSPAQEHGPTFNAAFDRTSRFGHDFSQIPTHPPAAGVIQTKLAINKPGDHYEQEADQIADQVMATSAHTAVSAALPCIQRFSGQSNGMMEAAPASIDEVLASLGRPLESGLRQDMEQRFGHDFSRVRVHSGAAGEQSAREVSAHAYTVGHNIVFGAGQFAPATQEGRRLIAHELAHVIQQTPPSPHQPSSSRGPTSDKTADSMATGIRHLPSRMLQRDVEDKPEDPWDKLSPSVRKQVQELYDECDDSIGILDEAQMVHVSRLRGSWLNFLRRTLLRIEGLDSDSKLTGVKNSYKDFDRTINSVIAKFREEWVAVEKRYLDEHRWLLSASVRSTDSIEAAKYLDQIYQQTKPSIPFLVTDEDYDLLKNALDKQEYVRVGALRGARIRAKQLEQMMNTVADLRRKGEDANKYIPEWSDRVLEEAAYLGSFAKLATEAGREYDVELADLRKRLLEKQQETLKVKPPEESGLEKVADFVEGGVEAIAGIFVEAAKEAVDLVQINLHFVTFGKYEPKFISDMAAAAEQGASTGDLLKGMVTGIVETPSRFLKACRDGDWKAIGRESVNLYMLAKTIKEAPETLKKIPEAAKKLPELLAKTRESLMILRERTVALGLKNEGRLSPEPRSQPAAPSPPAPKPAPTLKVEQGGGQGDGKPRGMLRDTDAASRGVQVDASHPVFKNKLPANDTPTPPQAQAAKVAVNATKDVPHGQHIDPVQDTPVRGQRRDQPAKAMAEEHTKGARQSTKGKHQKGRTREQQQAEGAEARADAAKQAGLESARNSALAKVQRAVGNLPDRIQKVIRDPQKSPNVRIDVLKSELKQQNSPINLDVFLGENNLTLQELIAFLEQHKLF